MGFSRILLNFTLDGLMISAIRSSNNAAREGKRTKEYLFKMRNECWDEQVAREVSIIKSDEFLKNIHI